MWLVLLCLAVACAPAATPRGAVAPGVLVVRDGDGRVLVNVALGLAAYPGSRVLAQRYEGSASRTEFETADALEAVYDFYHRALLARRWTRASFTLRGETRIEARYVGPSDDVNLSLERLAGGRYRLELR